MKIIILGAGISGMSFALKLKELDVNNYFEITILEKSDKAGGLVNSSNYKDYWFDNGCYYFFSDDYLAKRYNDLFSEVNSFTAKVWTQDGLCSFPPQAKYILSQSSFETKLLITKDLLLGNLSMIFRRPDNSKEWLNQRLGKKLVQLTGLDIYLEKLQRVSLGEISSSICISRLSALDKNIFSLVRHISRKKNHKPVNSKTKKMLYANGGIGQISKRLFTECKKQGINFSFNVDIVSLNRFNNNIQIKTNSRIYKTDKLVSTIPLPSLLDYLRIAESNKLELEYTKLLLTKILLKDISFKENNFYLYSFIKEHDWKRLSGIRMNDGMVSVVVETNLKRETLPDKAFYNQEIIDSLVNEIKLFKMSDIIYISNQIVDYSYPVFTKANEEYAEKMTALIEKDYNITLLGRQAEFKYYSTRSSINSAHQKAKQLYNAYKG